MDCQPPGNCTCVEGMERVMGPKFLWETLSMLGSIIRHSLSMLSRRTGGPRTARMYTNQPSPPRAPPLSVSLSLCLSLSVSLSLSLSLSGYGHFGFTSPRNHFMKALSVPSKQAVALELQLGQIRKQFWVQLRSRALLERCCIQNTKT